jgi:hypothetical protein
MYYALRIRRGTGLARTPRSGVSQLEEDMYAWIDGDLWAADGQPSLEEAHGWLVDLHTAETYGRFLSDDEATVITRALLAVQLELPLDS